MNVLGCGLAGSDELPLAIFVIPLTISLSYVSKSHQRLSGFTLLTISCSYIAISSSGTITHTPRFKLSIGGHNGRSNMLLPSKHAGRSAAAGPKANAVSCHIYSAQSMRFTSTDVSRSAEAHCLSRLMTRWSLALLLYLDRS